jgi:hypothetical protein
MRKPLYGTDQLLSDTPVLLGLTIGSICLHVTYNSPRWEQEMKGDSLVSKNTGSTTEIPKSTIFWDITSPAFTLVSRSAYFFDPEDGGDMFTRNIG